MEVEVCGEVWVPACYEGGEGEDVPFRGAEGCGGEVGFEGGEEGEGVFFRWVSEGHFFVVVVRFG